MRLLYSFPRPRISLRYIWPWSWAVTAPKKKKEAELANGGEPQEKFECASCPPFKIGDVRAAIPSHCWVKDPWRSMSYVLRDVVVIAALALAAGHLNSWIFWHIYWLAQGTMFWAIFVLGHDWYYSIISSVLRAPTASRGTNSRTCVGSGHGSFSDSVRLNNVVGHLLHSAILVPYHGCYPRRRTGDWLRPAEPCVFIMWLDLVTYLHHHGHRERLPWYRGKEWNYLRGGLTTLDRDYGWINNIHHDIGTHVVHHLFPQIPHYNLVEATMAAKPVLGKYYREPEKSWPLPVHLFGILLRSLRVDHFVSDEGDVVYYQTDPRLYAAGRQHKAQ
ncbi:hypothetical protein B296_00056009 [Ensete ventricosum]|uniref:Fatty acid desaturase domain-containing protein n=1 Tax=Ensete ventricosum TaxID=4639 RepID=A0A426WYK7_ENSVE|nr:hypothetical protein B296_00056009 [Ensete ventricosum]